MKEIAGAIADLAWNDVGVAYGIEVVVNTHIYDAKRETMLATEHIHATAAATIVDHLLPRHLARRERNALAFNAVISPKKDMTGMAQLGRKGLLDETDLHGNLFQYTQRAFGLVQVINLVLKCRT